MIPQERTTDITDVIHVCSTAPFTRHNQQIAQLKDLFDGEIITKDQFEKERGKLVNELNKIE